VVLATHDSRLIEAAGVRVLRLHAGRLASQTPAAQPLRTGEVRA
jgi:ABC-type ATPase involved in cell division